MMRILVCALSLVGVCLVGACDDGGGEGGLAAEKVTHVLTRAAVEPSEARQLLTDRAEGSLAEDAEDAGIPSEDVVAWLLEDHGFPDETRRAVAEVLQVATQPAAGSEDEAIAAEVVGSPQIDPALRSAVAGLLVDRIPEMMTSSRTNQPWSPDDLSRLLGALGEDATTRATVATAITDHARARISAGNLANGAIAAKVVRPTGWLLGVIDAGALERLDDGEANRFVDDRRLDLETLAEESMLDAGRSMEEAQAMSVHISGAYSEGLEAAD